MIADGQISLGPTVFKNTAKKLRKINDDTVCGFAGSAADCLALIELQIRNFKRVTRKRKNKGKENSSLPRSF